MVVLSRMSYRCNQNALYAHVQIISVATENHQTLVCQQMKQSFVLTEVMNLGDDHVSQQTYGNNHADYIMHTKNIQ